MSDMPTYNPVYRNRIEFIRSLGYSEMDVLQDGFQDDGLLIIGAWPDRGSVSEGHNMITSTLIPWSDNATREAAMAARQRDYDETNAGG